MLCPDAPRVAWACVLVCLCFPGLAVGVSCTPLLLRECSTPHTHKLARSQPRGSSAGQDKELNLARCALTKHAPRTILLRSSLRIPTMPTRQGSASAETAVSGKDEPRPRSRSPGPSIGCRSGSKGHPRWAEAARCASPSFAIERRLKRDSARCPRLLCCLIAWLTAWLTAWLEALRPAIGWRAALDPSPSAGFCESVRARDQRQDAACSSAYRREQGRSRDTAGSEHVANLGSDLLQPLQGNGNGLGPPVITLARPMARTSNPSN